MTENESKKEIVQQICLSLLVSGVRKEDLVIKRGMPEWQRAKTRRESFTIWMKEKKKGLVGLLNGTRTAENVKDHLAATTGAVMGGLPIYSLLEMGVVYLTPLQSLVTRATAAGAGYLGFNPIFVIGREAFYIACKVNEKSKGYKKRVADIAYQGIFNGLTYPVFAGLGRFFSDTSLHAKDIADETFIFTLTGLTAGMFVGMGIDAYRELLGTNFSSRVPPSVRNLPRSTKAGVAALAAAASLYATSLEHDYFSNWDYTHLPKSSWHLFNHGKEPAEIK
ncbi:hypothetical protein HYZ97_01450 [Candidatus Pacearchaeota archaeon]|nr:hypothetical protein [Candidatus Pacearchaeota archaeon]